jgi:hypothetical protein
MNKFILLLTLTIFASNSLFSSVIRDSVLMGPEYSQDIYYQLDGRKQTKVSNLNYHIAFANMVSQDDRFYATWINPETTKAFVSTNYLAKDFDTLKPNAQWRELYNQDTSWGKGAFSQGTEKHPRYTWASYAGNGDLRGDSIYKIQIKNEVSGNFDIEMKLWLKQRLSDNGNRTWTIKYGKIDNSWDTTIILNDLTISEGNFMYYDFVQHKEIQREPKTNSWDLVFTRYSTFTQGLQYNVTGVLNNYNVSSLKVLKSINDVTADDYSLVNKNWNAQINAIGFDWKYFNRNTFKYELEQNTTRIIFVPSGTAGFGDLYAIQFVEFEGRSTGKIVFDYKYLGQTSSVQNKVPANFALYPNPASNNLFIKSTTTITNAVITDNLGRIVLNAKPAGNMLPISNLSSGLYTVTFLDNNNLSWKAKFIKE